MDHKITLEVNGLDELTALLEKASALAAELQEVADEISAVRLSVAAKLNQPTAGTEG